MERPRSVVPGVEADWRGPTGVMPEFTVSEFEVERPRRVVPGAEGVIVGGEAGTVVVVAPEMIWGWVLVLGWEDGEKGEMSTVEVARAVAVISAAAALVAIVIPSRISWLESCIFAGATSMRLEMWCDGG